MKNTLKQLNEAIGKAEVAKEWTKALRASFYAALVRHSSLFSFAFAHLAI